MDFPEDNITILVGMLFDRTLTLIPYRFLSYSLVTNKDFFLYIDLKAFLDSQEVNLIL